MTVEFAQALIAAFGLILVALSIWFLARQTAVEATATRAIVFQNVSQMVIDLDRFFISHPELKQYFYAQQDISGGEKEYEQVKSVAEMILDVAEATRVHAPFFDDYPWDTLGRFFFDLYSASPILRRFLEEHEAWYPTELSGMFRTGRVPGRRS